MSTDITGLGEAGKDIWTGGGGVLTSPRANPCSLHRVESDSWHPTRAIRAL